MPDERIKPKCEAAIEWITKALQAGGQTVKKCLRLAINSLEDAQEMEE